MTWENYFVNQCDLMDTNDLVVLITSPNDNFAFYDELQKSND
jgi:hypothetical protein